MRNASMSSSRETWQLAPAELNEVSDILNDTYNIDSRKIPLNLDLDGSSKQCTINYRLIKGENGDQFAIFDVTKDAENAKINSDLPFISCVLRQAINDNEASKELANVRLLIPMLQCKKILTFSKKHYVLVEAILPEGLHSNGSFKIHDSNSKKSKVYSSKLPENIDCEFKGHVCHGTQNGK